MPNAGRSAIRGIGHRGLLVKVAVSSRGREVVSGRPESVRSIQNAPERRREARTGPKAIPDVSTP